MNLYENIQRIQSLLTENREEMIKNMISKHGLYHTITLMGGYEKILNTVGHEYFTNDDKIDFIKQVVYNLSKKNDTSGLVFNDVGLDSVTFGTPDPYGLEFQQIEYFAPDYITIEVYDKDSHRGAFLEKYENLDDNTLDNVFTFMIDALEDYM